MSQIDTICFYPLKIIFHFYYMWCYPMRYIYGEYTKEVKKTSPSHLPLFSLLVIFVLPFVSLSRAPLLRCFPCLCDLFDCFKTPGLWVCCVFAAIFLIPSVKQTNTCFLNFQNCLLLYLELINVISDTRLKKNMTSEHNSDRKQLGQF